jgi:hypothetical protein
MISRTQAATGSASMVPSTVRRGGRFEEAEILPGDLGWPELTRLGSLRGLRDWLAIYSYHYKITPNEMSSGSCSD